MMNQRIQELLKQATTVEYGVDNGFDRTTVDQEKFAESIVRECAHIAWLNSTQDNISHTKIREHFGVK